MNDAEYMFGQWVYRDKGVTEMERVTWSIYSDGGCMEIQLERRWNEQCGVYIRETPGWIDSISFSSHLVIQRNYTLNLSQLLLSLGLSEISWLRAMVWTLTAG